MKKYEYKKHDISATNVNEALNLLGEEGWLLVSKLKYIEWSSSVNPEEKVHMEYQGLFVREKAG